jgi:hypothetical protein
LLVAISLAVLAIGSFLGGRELESQAVAAKSRASRRNANVTTASATPAPANYRQLPIAEILSLPFPEFYESLRAAPREARAKWIAELEKMPINPKRSSAWAGFYKLLVQFDPVAAANAVARIPDREPQGFILEAVVDAAPTFAMRDMAKLLLQLTTPESRERRLFENVINEWSTVDPAAAAQFLEEHPESGNFSMQHFVINWAAVDPGAAKAWLEHHPQGDYDFRYLIQGWYLNDRTAAVAYTLAHPQEASTAGALEDLLSGLYVDSEEEAKKFLERLPNDELRRRAFRDFGFLNALPADEPSQRQTPPRALADWMTQFPPGYWQGALTSVLRQWSFESSPQDIVDWITLQPAQVRDAVAAEFVYDNYMKIDDAVRPIFGIADPSLRDRLLWAMFQHMEYAPTEDLARAVEQSSLGSSEKQQVLKVMQQVLAANEASPKQPGD